MRPGEPPIRTRRRHPRVHLPIVFFGALLVAYWVVVAFVLAIDPLDLYPWGGRAVVANKSRPREATELFDLAAKDPDVDLVVVGSSTTTAYTPDILKQAIPGVKNPWNLSYYGARPADREVLTRELLKYTRARHIILNADWVYSQPVDFRKDGFPAHLYDSDPLNDLRGVNLDSLRMAVRAAMGMDLFGGGRGDPEGPANAVKYARFQSPERMRALAAIIDHNRPDITRPTSLTCADFPALNEQLVPFAKAATARGITLDILIPPYSLATWFQWRASPEKAEQFGPSVFEDQMMLRRCLVTMLSDLPGVKIYAYDDRAALSGNLANYWDPPHLYNPRALREILTMMVAGEGQLTTSTVDAYVQRLRLLVKSYHLTDSRAARPGASPPM